MTNWGATILFRYIICPLGVFVFLFSLLGLNGDPSLNTLGIWMGLPISILGWFGSNMFKD